MDAESNPEPMPGEENPVTLLDLVKRVPAMLRDLPTWAKANPRRAGMVGGGVGLTLSILLCLSWYLSNLRDNAAEGLSVELAIEMLDLSQFNRAEQIIDTLSEADAIGLKELGAAAYVRGVIAFQKGEEGWESGQNQLQYVESSKLLSEAYDRGFPPEREMHGLVLLGISRFRSEEYEKASSSFREALAQITDEKMSAELLHLLSQSYVRHPNPLLEEGLTTINQFLEMSHLTKEEREQGQLEKGKLQLQLGDVEGSRATLSSLDESTRVYSQVLVALGELQLIDAEGALSDEALGDEEARQLASHQHLREAIVTFRRASKRDTLENGSGRMAMYLTGVALHRLGDLSTAQKQLERTELMYAETDERIAAMLEGADTLRDMGSDVEAVAKYQELLEVIKQADSFSNRWLSVEEIRSQIRAAYDYYVEIHHYQESIEIARAFYPLASRIDSVTMLAQSQEAWAEHLRTMAEGQSYTERNEMLKESRLHFREAGVNYARLAKLQFSDAVYPEHIWHAAENYRKGRDFDHAVQLYDRYLENSSRKRWAKALLGLGESQLAMQDAEKSLATLHLCISTFPLDPISYRARLVCSQAHRELGQEELARQLLKDNLYNESLTPASVEWRDSLFDLGTTLYDEAVAKLATARSKGLGSEDELRRKEAMPELEQSYGLFQEAIDRLDEAVRRYPDAPQIVLARYQLAESHRQSARLPEEHRRNVAIETTRRKYQAEGDTHLGASLAVYISLQESLILEQDERELSPADQAILRNCYFARGAVLYQLHQYSEAIRAYASASSRFQREPIALEAQLQIASCHRQLDRPLDAHGSIEHALLILEGIPEETDFTLTTRYSRQEWIDLLSWMSETV